MPIDSPIIPAVLERTAELDRLGDEIAELSAHLDAATARRLDLIREFDARAGWALSRRDHRSTGVVGGNG